jgi:hypothetical protein
MYQIHSASAMPRHGRYPHACAFLAELLTSHVRASIPENIIEIVGPGTFKRLHTGRAGHLSPQHLLMLMRVFGITRTEALTAAQQAHTDTWPYLLQAA